MPSSGMLRHVALVRADFSEVTEEGILHKHCREDPKSYIALTGWAL
jgi:hypothetical protein